eukprot:4837428-Amphidinium_carterae.2
MHSGQRRILIQGAVDAVHVTCELPSGCGLPVDLLHAFLVRTLRSAGRQEEVRKYVNDMILCCRTLIALATCVTVIGVSCTKTVVECNGTRAKQKLWQVWTLACRPPSSCEACYP